MHFRKFNKTFCTLSLAALYTFTTYGATVTDVTSTHWAYSAIVDLEGRGIMSLNSSGQFFPNQMMDYFELSDVLAKATGYVDADVTKGADADLVAQIAANYERQKATLQTYASKYKTWNSAYNQQIAYLLGRGYLTTKDLDKFITKSNTSEVKNAVTKEEISIFVVRMLGKAVTATQEYKTTGFTDESSISEEARPYMAYLKGIGIVNADAAGKGNGKAKVTKALCAKMVDSALQIKENTSSEPVTDVTTDAAGTKTAVVKKVLTKNTTEYYLLLQIGDNTSYYSIKNVTKILDANGSEMAITKLTGETIAVTMQMEGNTEYITSARVASANAGTQVQTTPNTNGQITNENTVGTVTGLTTISGTLTQPITNGICRLTLTDGTAKTYILDTDCTISLNNANVDESDIQVGDTVFATVNGSIITAIQAISGSNSQLSDGEVTAKGISQGNYTFTIKQGVNEQTVTIPATAVVTRNLKTVNASKIRIGDVINLTKVNGIVTQVTATSTKTSVQGTISQLMIGAEPQVVLSVNQTKVTYTLASDAEIYDAAEDKVISIRDLHIGQTASLLLDSKEVVSLDVDSKADSVSIIGTISNVGKRASYIEVLIDYDYITGESKVYKRIELSDDVKVSYNGRSKDIYDLEEDMNVVITYKYLDDLRPQKITIIS